MKYNTKQNPLQRLTIRERREVLLIKKAIKLLLDTCDHLSLDQQMSAIEVYHKTNRALLTHKQ